MRAKQAPPPRCTHIQSDVIVEKFLGEIDPFVRIGDHGQEPFGFLVRLVLPFAAHSHPLVDHISQILGRNDVLLPENTLNAERSERTFSRLRQVT